ncbi:unnamed protein product [Parnassius apollo]|uniref:(apollo) hypothetical protein n=1 Tax=Parnassius apollo TaxID=110799 RepID=A0A8S3WXI2_PARAO|nr:unnamed protein product [Parnassius apollo]
MADSDRVVYPDEVDEAKKNATEAKTVEASKNASEEITVNSDIQTRNMISVPQNCPSGYKMGSDGVCREVFD